MSAKLAPILTHLLSESGLTANGLAVILDIPTPTIYRIAVGDVVDPRLSTLCRIADYFDITLEQLVGRAPINKKITRREK